jgi:putative peptidoglycan lipid II flippase
MKEISVARGTVIVSFLTLISRFLGFFRDLLIAKGFGSSVYADCFFIAFRIPNLLRSLVAEGALSSAFVPIFADSVKEGQSAPNRTFQNVLGFVLSLTVLLTALGILFSESIVSSFAPGLKQNQEVFELCVSMTAYMLPMIICLSLVALINAALNTLGNFGAAAWAQIYMNLTLIAGAAAAMYFESVVGVKLLAWSALAGSIVQVLIQIPALLKNKLSFRPNFSIFNSQIALLLKLMLPAIIGATVYQLGIFLNTLLASLLEEGSVSWLYYADRLIQFPLGTFSIALGSVLLPALALSHSKGQKHDFSSKTFSALGFTAFFMLPLTIFIFIFAKDIISIIYERGSFSSRDTEMTASAVRAYTAGLWAISSYGLLARTFIARKDTVTATLVGVFSLFINFCVSLLTIGALKQESGIIANIQAELFKLSPSLDLGHTGLALASAIAANFSFLLLALLSRKHLEADWKSYLYTSFISGLIAIFAAWICIELAAAINASRLITLCASLVFGGFIYVSFCSLLGVKESKLTLNLLRSRMVR